MKAITMLQTSTTVAKRAEQFAESIQRNIQTDVLDRLKTRKDKLNDELFSLQDFNLGTNINAGIQAITRDEAEKRFKRIIEVEYELELLDRELQIKQQSFNNLFSNDTDKATATTAD